jgi:hypothetical protein
VNRPDKASPKSVPWTNLVDFKNKDRRMKNGVQLNQRTLRLQWFSFKQVHLVATCLGARSGRPNRPAPSAASLSKALQRTRKRNMQFQRQTCRPLYKQHFVHIRGSAALPLAQIFAKNPNFWESFRLMVWRLHDRRAVG